MNHSNQTRPEQTRPEQTRPEQIAYDSLPHHERRTRRPQSDKRLRRSSTRRVVAGVFGGVAEFVDADVRWVRGLYLAVVLLSGGLAVIGYPILWLLLPDAARPTEPTG